MTASILVSSDRWWAEMNPSKSGVVSGWRDAFALAPLLRFLVESKLDIPLLWVWVCNGSRMTLPFTECSSLLAEAQPTGA
jgi:hypothetical protein